MAIPGRLGHPVIQQDVPNRRLRQTIGRKRLALALSFAFLGSLPLTGTAQTPAAPLPDGIYRYVILDSGKPSGVSAIRVSRSGGDLVIEEHASPMEETEQSRRALDPLTFATRSYADESSGKPVFTLTIDGKTATLAQGTSLTKVSALPGAPFVVFDYYVGLFFHLPATLHAAKRSTFSLVTVGSALKAEPLVASVSNATRPVGVPRTDASMAVTIEGATGTLWYDPHTFVLDEFDLPTLRITFKRVLSGQ